MKDTITADFENWITTDLEDWESYKYITNNKNTNPWYDVDDDFYVVLPDNLYSFFPTTGSFCLNGGKRYELRPLMHTEKMADDMSDEFFESITKNDREVIIGTAIENYHLNIFYRPKDCVNHGCERNLLEDLILRLKCEVKYDCYYTRLNTLIDSCLLIKSEKQRFNRYRTLYGNPIKGITYILSPIGYKPEPFPIGRNECYK